MNDLRTLSDAELVESLRALEAQQRGTMAAIVGHLIEIEERRLHLRLGYSSLFDYCQRALGLSEDEAYRRMTVARLASKWPAIVDGLADGSLHLSGVALLKSHLRVDNCGELLEMARGASRRQLERRLAARFPQSDSAEFLRAQKVKPLSAERIALQLTIGEATRVRLERALDLMSHVNPSRSLEAVLDRALEVLVQDLERSKLAKTKLAKLERPKLAEPRPAKAAKLKASATNANVPSAQRDGAPSLARAGAGYSAQRDGAPSLARAGAGRSIERAANPGATRTRAIPRPIRRQVFERDGTRCSFVAENGERCGCRTRLELDHIEPWAVGGPSDPANLRVLCRAHNRLAAEEWFGKERIQGAKIAGGGG